MVQLEFSFVQHKVDNEIVPLRQKDGFIDATKMCKAAGREFKDYNRLKSTEAFLNELSAEVKIPTSELVQSVSGGNPQVQGTWVHPRVAIHLAQWLSPRFAVLVSGWVYDWMSGKKATPVNLPYHMRRYVTNQRNVPKGHFSVLNEMSLALIAPMEADGYTLPENMLPDISQGKMFAKWLRDKYGVDTNAIPTYNHVFEDGRVVQAKAYPNEWLKEFREHFEGVWIPQKAIEYFKGRDASALPHLNKMLGLTGPDAPTGIT